MIKVVISNTKRLYDLTEEESVKIKEDLSIINPQYLQVKRYSKYSSTKVPKYLFYYNEEKDHLEVPVGYTLPFEYEVKEDLREERTVAYPSFLLTLRDTQKLAYKTYIQDTDKGILSLPTGKGKSILGLYLAYKLKQKALVIVHKDDLVNGWTKDYELCFGRKDVGLIKAKKRVIGDTVTIATIQTLSRLTDEELERVANEFGMIIVDEMHHISSSIYQLINNFSCPYKVGLSATPERSDGLDKVMHFYLGEFAYVYEQEEGDTDILPVEIKVKEVDIFYRPRVSKQGKEYVLDVNGTRYIDEIDAKQRPKLPYTEVVDLVVNHQTYKDIYLKDIVREFNLGRSIVIFLSQKEHCRQVFEDLLHEGVPESKMQLYYGDATEKKDVMIERAENNRQLITIATYSIATEGTNVKQWEVAFLVSSINDEKNTEQAVGRVRRSKKGKLDTVLVYDYRFPKVYMMKNHGFTRDKRYKKLGFTVSYDNLKRDLFSRGYRK